MLPFVKRQDTLASISSIVDQHAQDAVSLWSLRRRAVSAPDYSLRDLIKLDYRLDANLDGLRLAEDAGWKLCEELIGQEGAAGVFTAAIAAFSSTNEARIQRVLEVLVSRLDLGRGMVSALGWLPFAQAEIYIKKFLAAEAPALRRLGIAAAAIHRQYPGTELLEAITQVDPSLRARGLRAVGELGREELVGVAADSLDSDNEAVRFAAAWSVTLLSPSPKATAVLASVAESKSPLRENAMGMAIRGVELEAAKAWQRELSQSPGQLRLAIAGAGAIGDPEIITWLITQMYNPKLARLACEAFTMITGVDSVREHLEGQRPEGFESGPTESPEDENVEMDEDERLQWPDPPAVERWWTEHKPRFTPGIRHLLGHPISADWLHQVLRIGRQRERAAAALEIAIQSPGQPLFNVHAPGFRQQRLLGIER